MTVENKVIYTKFDEVDALTHGFRGGDLVVIGSRPGMGKSDLAMNIGLHVALHQDKTVTIVSLEQNKVNYAERMLSAQVRIDHLKLLTGTIDEEDEPVLALTTEVLSEAKLFIQDQPRITVPEIQAQCQEIKDEHGLGLVIVDYVQLVQPTNRYDNRYQEMAEISRSLKIMARELDVPVIAVSQLSRAAELRNDKRPIMSDLRDSGTLEDDADIILFLYREDYYNPDLEPPKTAEVIVAKHRNGPIGKAELVYLKHMHKFVNYSK